MKKQGTWKTVAALFAFAAFAPAGAAAETYAKPVPDGGTGGYVLKFFTKAECTEENTEQTAIDGETTVFFASDAEFQALVARKDEIDDAGAKVVLQDDVKLTENVDWSAFDFNINEKTITLAGCKLSAGRIAGTGTVLSAGELVENGDFESKNGRGWNSITASNGGWSRVGDCNILIAKGTEKDMKRVYKPDGSYWAALCTTNANHRAVAAIKQTVTLPKDGTYYLTFRYRTGAWDDSGDNYYTFFNGKPKLKVTASWATGSKGNEHYTPSTSIKPACIELPDMKAGDRLTLQFASSDEKYGLSIDDVSLTPLSILELKVEGAKDYDVDGLTLKGTGLQVVKSGAGRIVFSKSNASWRYNGYVSLVVKKGYAKQTVKNACGAQYSKIEVCDGAQFDFNGMTYWDYNYQISGSGPAGDGALTSYAPVSAEDARKKVGYGFLKDVTLGADATISAIKDANFGMWVYWASGETTNRVSEMTMNGYTVTYDCQTPGGAIIYLGGMSYFGEGKIVVAANATVQPHHRSPEAKGCDVEVRGLWKQNGYVLSPVKSLVFREGSRFGEWNESPTNKTVVYERYAPNQGIESDDQPVKHPIVQLGDKDHQSPTLDLSYHSGAFYDNGKTPTLRYYDTEDPEHPMNVKVDVSERNCARGRAIYIYGTNTPANVRFVAGEKMVAAKISLRVREHGDDEDGLYTLPGTTIVIR